jgi:ABC-type tungstate transport system substrate-binding protein
VFPARLAREIGAPSGEELAGLAVVSSTLPDSATEACPMVNAKSRRPSTFRETQSLFLRTKATVARRGMAAYPVPVGELGVAVLVGLEPTGITRLTTGN